VVWLLDAASPPDSGRGYDALVDWQPDADKPRRFSLSTVKAELSAAQQTIMDSENRLEEREELNLLYVAMTRAQQAFILSGSETRGRKPGLWYEKVRAAALAASGGPDDAAAVAVHGDDLAISPPARGGVAHEVLRGGGSPASSQHDPRLNAPLPTGERRPTPGGRGLAYGVSFHSLMENLTGGAPAERAVLRRALGLTEHAFAPMWDQAQRVLAAPALARFFDAARYSRALNEVPYATESGEVRRIDRLVEFADAVWVLDYKTGDRQTADPALTLQYRAQLAEYRDAMRRVYGAGRKVNAAIVFADGSTLAIEDD
jgi:ATP-dependent helicase/nuclease subunit A